MDRLVEGRMTEEVLQLDQVHAGLVGESAEGPSKVVVGDPDSLFRESGPVGGALQEEVGSGTR